MHAGGGNGKLFSYWMTFGKLTKRPPVILGSSVQFEFGGKSPSGECYEKLTIHNTPPSLCFFLQILCSSINSNRGFEGST